MGVQPASLEQVQQDAGFVDIRPGENEIAAALAAIDPGLRIRFSKAGRCWIIEHWHHDDCPCNRPYDRQGSRYFVTSVQAVESKVSGVWTGLDGRVIEKMQQLNPLGRRGYNLAAELELSRRERERADEYERHEMFGELAEHAAFRLRRDNGERYKGRIFKPNDRV